MSLGEFLKNCAILILAAAAAIFMTEKFRSLAEDRSYSPNDKRGSTRDSNDHPDRDQAPILAESCNQKWHPQEDHHRRIERGYWKRQFCIGVVSAVLSAIAVVGAIAGVWIASAAFQESRNASLAAQGQLAEMRAESRPWMKVSVEKTGGVTVFTYPPDRRPDNNDLVIQFNPSFRIENAGKSPGFGVQFVVHIFVRNRDQLDPIAGIGKACEQARKSGTSRWERIGVIFPGDVEHDPHMFAPGAGMLMIINREVVEKALTDVKVIEIFAVGCVDYIFPDDLGTHHQTGFAFQIFHIKHTEFGDVRDISFPVYKWVPESEIKYFPVRVPASLIN